MLRAERVKPEAVLRLEIAVPYSRQFYSARVRESGSWTSREVIADVPPDAESIKISFSLRDTGLAWATNFEFQEVSISVPLTSESGPQNLDFTLHDK
jgi:hypothetical protein